MKFWVLLIAGAVSPFLWATTLPSRTAIAMLLLTGLLALRPGLRVYCVLPAFFMLTTLAVNDRLSQRLASSESQASQTIKGVIGSLPVTRDHVTRFIFVPDSVTPTVPPRIRVSWYETRTDASKQASKHPIVHAGEHWQLQLELRHPRGRVNFHGVDAERWYFVNGVGALASVKRGSNIRLAPPAWFNLQHWRESVLEKLTTSASTAPAFRVLAALAVADRRGLLEHDMSVLSATGTGHLLAISGLHIGLAAVMGFYLGRMVLLLIPFWLQRRLTIVLPWLCVWLAALAYSLLSGFGIATQRALIMLTVATIAVISRRNIHPLLAWVIAMAMVVVMDPFAPLRAGFWFSFVAVLVLITSFAPRYGHVSGLRKMCFAQLSISLILAPLGMFWFQQASLPGLLANLIAIPVVSLLIVPLILTALLLLWLPGPLTSWLLTAAGYLAHWVFLMLDQLAKFQPAILGATRAPGLAETLLAILGAAMMLLPKGVPGRLAGLALMLPLLLPLPRIAGDRQMQIDFLDVGQGLAVLLTSRDYQLLYDSGPGNGLAGSARWDMVTGTLRPMINATGAIPDLIVTSNADLDHAGGLDSLRSSYPQAKLVASLPHKRPGIDQCSVPGAWTATDFKFKILHPSEGLPYLGNDSSCVISVNGPGLSVLLSGDISRFVEQRLVDEGLGHHDILSAPHHGSSTSSSPIFIDTLKPSLVVFSSGHSNRFGFPRADVLQRYAQAHIPGLNTAQCGGIRIRSDGLGNFKITSARVSRKAIWRLPADTVCP